MTKLKHNSIFCVHFIWTFLLSILFCSYQTTDNVDEYTIKGMFIYNFTKYIDWSAFKNSDSFVIAVYGESDITQNLNQIAVNKKVNNKNIKIKTITGLNESDDVQIIYIPKSNNAALKETIAKLGSKNILIVTEDKDMALKGSCINIITVDGKVKFELNESAVKRDGLKLASQLISLAIIIK